ncbi:MAG TPA: NAD(P)/FAD-dependent oxidoreductase [Halothiobacillaceae bacterium]|nr:NAD(P)/FAD-dependent oxidoreductase [Halothiobacillaceae bacterium]
MTEQDVFDITIVGGGPSGLFAAFYAGLRGAKTKIIDSLPQLGGQLAALYPDKYIYDVPGFPKVLAQDFVDQQVEQAMAFSPSVNLAERVMELKHREENGHLLIDLKTEPGNVHVTRTVIVAAGVGAFIPRKLDIPDLDRLEGRGVYYFVKDLERFKGKHVLVVGGGDTALDWALGLQGIADQVILAHRRDRFRAHEESVEELFESPSKILLFHELKELHGDDHLEAATVFDNQTGEETLLDVDAVVLGLGFLANLGPIREWGLEIYKNSIEVDATMRTNLPAVYAVGDITTYEGKLKLIATATAEAAVAANYAKNYVDPTSRIYPGHSSNKDVR